MKLYSKIFLMMIHCVACVGCNDEDETMSCKPGTGLHIVGPDEVVVAEENDYYVDGFTINESYTWTLDGAAVTPIRQGEFVQLVFDAPERIP